MKFHITSSMFSKRMVFWVTRTTVIGLTKLAVLTFLCILCFYVMAVQHRKSMLEHQARSANNAEYSESIVQTEEHNPQVRLTTSNKIDTHWSQLKTASASAPDPVKSLRNETPSFDDLQDNLEDENDETFLVDPASETPQTLSHASRILQTGKVRDDISGKTMDDTSASYGLFGEQTRGNEDTKPFDQEVKEPTTLKKPPGKLKTILLWNHFFLKKDFGLELGTQLFEGVGCTSTCNITTDRRAQKTADAVVIHAFHLMKDLKDATVPDRASQKQIFVFLLLENPQRSQPGLVNLPYNDLFNLTFTYLDDPRTDLYTPYGLVERRTETVEHAVPTMEAINQKNKSVAWLISNCHAPSSRYEYVEILSQHIDVEILGKCGRDSCPRGLDCMEFMDRQYLFYLAFENGYCKDYMTEKTFRTLRHSNMVPVVLGGANYSKVLPAKSYIDVREYKSPRELADYLKYLSDNRTAYMEYFRWKRDYHITTLKKVKFLNFCKLCGILHDDTYQYKQNFKPLDYWDPELCLTGDDEREAVHIF